MPVNLSQIPQDFHKAVEQGQFTAVSIGPALDEHVSTQLLKKINAGHLSRAQALEAFDQIRAEQKGQQAELERKAFSLSTLTDTPESALGAGTVAGLALGSTQALSHAPTAISPLVAKISPRLAEFARSISPLSWQQTVSGAFGPSTLPFSVLTDLGSTAVAPLMDPLYQRGERGYFSSLSDAAKARMDQFERAGTRVRENYDEAGVPIQVIQNMFSPFTGMTFAGKELYKSLNSQTAEELSMQAEKDLSKYLGD